MKHTKLLWILAGMGLLIIIAMYGLNGGKIATAQEETVVDCGAGQSLADAVNQASIGDTILVTGTCTETLTITTDRITIDGQGSAIIDGGGDSVQAVITVDGVQRVAIKSMTIRNGNDGILARRGAAVILEGLVVENNTNEGIEIDENSTAQVTDCTILQNGGDGFFVNRASSVTFRGETISNNNTDDGISITSNSTAHIASNSSFTVNNNAENGAQAVLSSTLNLFSDATLTIQNNVSTGLLVFEASHAELLGTTLISNNGGGGILVSNNAGADLTSNLQVMNNNGAGVSVTRNSRASILFLNGNSPNISNNNGVGIGVDYSFVSISGASITGNVAIDINLQFGTRAEIFSSATFNNIVCDGTTLLTGNNDVTCPTP